MSYVIPLLLIYFLFRYIYECILILTFYFICMNLPPFESVTDSFLSPLCILRFEPWRLKSLISSQPCLSWKEADEQVYGKLIYMIYCTGIQSVYTFANQRNELEKMGQSPSEAAAWFIFDWNGPNPFIFTFDRN